MQALLIGHGKVGRLIEQLANEYDVKISTVLCREYCLSLQQGAPQSIEFNENALRHINVAIDFSGPDGILDRIDLITQSGIPLIIGTTGWTDLIQNAKAIVKKNDGCCVFSPNFSIGVNLFSRLACQAAQMLDPYGYDIAEFEIHHREKKDHPSGTALSLAESLLESSPSKRSITTQLQQGAIKHDQLHVSHLRCGHNPGTYTVMYDSSDDLIQIQHIARGRHGYAKGALLAAKWSIGKKGWFNFQDVLKSFSSWTELDFH